MSLKQRLKRLEQQLPKPEDDPFPDFNVYFLFQTRSECQIEIIRRLRLYAHDPRATPSQREEWLAAIPSIESALKWELESERRRACPECKFPHHDPFDGILHKCRRCGCPVYVHGDGHVTDARPDVQG